MNNTLSANTLFHFTRSKEALLNILKGGLYVRYCLEDYGDLFEDDSEIVLPMTCFCDIPLSQTKNHITNYGKYAIGLSKEWGIKNGVSPVLYAHKNSSTSIIIKNLQNEIKEILKSEKLNKIDFSDENTEFELGEKIRILSEGLIDFIKYIKPYQSNGEIFYNEREWRFSPSIEKFRDIFKSKQILMSKLFKAHFPPKLSYKPEYFKDPIKRRAINIKLAPHLKLEFEPSDVKFIIVEKDSEIPEFIKKMANISWKSASQESLKILETRLISMDQIIEDL